MLKNVCFLSRCRQELPVVVNKSKLNRREYAKTVTGVTAPPANGCL
jgi:hypothetical protein